MDEVLSVSLTFVSALDDVSIELNSISKQLHFVVVLLSLSDSTKNNETKNRMLFQASTF